MIKKKMTIIILAVLFSCSCNRSQEKTEIIVQLSEADYFYSLCINPQDSIFKDVFNLTKSSYNPEKDDFVSFFENKLLERDANCKLATLFASFELKEKINYNSSNQEVIAILKEEIKLAKEATMPVLKKRIESAFDNASSFSKIFNKMEVIIKVLPEKNSYSITLNRKADKTQLTNLLQTKADMGFWETYNVKEIFDYLSAVNKKLKDSLSSNAKVDSSDFNKEKREFEKENPLFAILIPSVSQNGEMLDGAVVGYSQINDTAKVNQYFSMPDVKNLLPRNLKLLWEIKPIEENKEYINLVAIKITNRDGLPPLSGSCITQASAKESNGHSVVSIKMNAEGAKIWSRMTRDNVEKQIAIVVNNSVYSYPKVMAAIEGGNSEISGNFTLEEANNLASILNAGVMPKISVKVIAIN